VTSDIHPTAIVSPDAGLGEGVVIGPYAVVGPDVKLDDGVSIGSHAVVEGDTKVGAKTRIFPHTVIGTIPQDVKFEGEESRLVIGENCTFREFVTVNRGTKERRETVVGSNVLAMAYSHVAHDCIVGDDCILSNAVTLAGHVELGDYVVIGGLAAVRQFCRIGDHAFVGGLCGISKDVMPYVKVGFDPTRVVGLNTVGLQRRGFGEKTRGELKKAYSIVFRQNLNTTQALEKLEAELGDVPEVRRIIDFIKTSELGLLK
jgi:UDP-N-acetylglucosamine acyltransferase